MSNAPLKKAAWTPPLQINLLESRFKTLWQSCAERCSRELTDQTWSMLSHRYSETHRFYHDQGHLAHCLEQLDLAMPHIREPRQVEMAIWFHDLVNEPGARDNEILSAEKFRAVASGMMDADFIACVEALILATTHQSDPVDPDQQFICDIDLTSFGCPWDCFIKDSAAVKAEYPGSEADYNRGKKIFLESLLARRQIFMTDFFHQRYEQLARENIRRLLEMTA